MTTTSKPAPTKATPFATVAKSPVPRCLVMRS